MAKTVKITSINTISVVELPSWDVKTQGREIRTDCTETVKTQRMLDLFKDTIVMIVDESGLIKNRSYERPGYSASGKSGAAEILFTGSLP